MTLCLVVACKESKGKRSAQSSLAEFPAGVEISKTKKQDLRSILGAPAVTYGLPNEGDQSVEVLNYKEQGSFRFVDQKLESYFRNPANEDEAKVQYWRQKWSSLIVREEELKEEEIAGHDPVVSQLINEKERMTIVFEKLSGQVIRIVHYE